MPFCVASCALAFALASVPGGPDVAPSAVVPNAVASPAALDPALQRAPYVAPALAARARNWLRRIRTGNVDRTQLNAAANSVLTDDVLLREKAGFSRLGVPIAFTFVDRKRVAPDTAYTFRVTFARGTYFWIFAVDDARKISGLRLVAAP